MCEEFVDSILVEEAKLFEEPEQHDCYDDVDDCHPRFVGSLS
jgi:hypothetical protein